MRAHVGEFLDDDRIVEEVNARAAIFHGSARRDKALRTEPAPRLAVADSGLVPVRDLRYNFFFKGPLNLITEELVFLIENIAAHIDILSKGRAKAIKGLL